MQINSTKKNNLLKVVRSQRNYDYSSYLIERLIKEKRLNYLIEKIDNIKVKLHNSNIEKFNRAIVYSFIFNLNKFKHCSTTIENFIEKYNLNTNNMSNKDIEKNAIILKKLVLSNYKEMNLTLLFLNYQFYFDDRKRNSWQKENISFQFFITIYEMFIEIYYKKEKAIDEFIQ